MRVAIIGAGIAGLCAARELKNSGVSVSLFDKSRGVGGRLSTRYAGEYEFDHGAQYFTVKNERFKALIDEAHIAEAVERWAGRAIYLKKGLLTSDTGGARWVGTPRMNSFAKFLAKGLDVSVGERVSSMERKSDGLWTLYFEDSVSGPIQDRSGFDAVICTAPPAQAETLLPQGFSERDALASAQMDACFALMIGLPQVIDVGWDSLRVNDLPVSWLAVNSAKPGRKAMPGTLMVHASPEWSNANVETDRDEIINTMISITALLTKLDLSDPSYITLHRWLYASVSKTPEKPCLFDSENNLVAAGDWCLGGRVEGAALSGLAAAECLMTR